MSRDSRVEEFQTSIANVTRLLSNSRYTPYIEFCIGDFKVSTQKNNNYFMQLNVQYTGAGTANTVNLELAYVPKPGEDPNYIDKVLDGAVAYHKPCYLRYGYSGSPLLLSPLYEYIITDYKISLRDNMIYYSLTVISSIAKFKEYRTDFPIGRDLMKPYTAEDGSVYYYSENIAEEVRRTFDEIFKDEGYKTVLDEGVYTNSNWINLKPMDNVTVFQYVDTLLNQIEDKETDQAVYWYSFEDKAGDKRIYIHRSINEESRVLEEGLESLFTFAWGGNPQNQNNNTLVYSFENSFTGAINIASIDQLSQDRYVINSAGEEVKVSGLEHVDVGDYARNDIVVSNREWVKASTWVYDAQMEIAGIPADIPISVLIRVRPIIYGREHHTGGIYMIIGANSNINSNGFTTTLKLVRYGNWEQFKLLHAIRKIKALAEEKQNLWNKANPSPTYSTYNDYSNRNNYVNINSREMSDYETPSTNASATFIPDPEAEARKAQQSYENQTNDYVVVDRGVDKIETVSQGKFS